MRKWIVVVPAMLAMMFVLGLGTALAVSPDDATCAVSVTVDSIGEWEGDAFPAIGLTNITAQASQVTGSASLVLYTNANLTITADKTTAAQLSETGGDTLVTEYKLEYDGNGTTTTGGSTVDWEAYDTFTGVGSAVTHIAQDGAVQVTLSARASNDAGNVPDAGSYSATQKLTATW